MSERVSERESVRERESVCEREREQTSAVVPGAVSAHVHLSRELFSYERGTPVTPFSYERGTPVTLHNVFPLTRTTGVPQGKKTPPPKTLQ